MARDRIMRINASTNKTVSNLFSRYNAGRTLLTSYSRNRRRRRIDAIFVQGKIIPLYRDRVERTGHWNFQVEHDGG